MKIETNVNIGEQSKASMIANKIPIPKSFLTFEMSPEKAAIFANSHAMYRKLIVSEDEIYTENFYINSPQTKKVQNGIDHKDGYVSGWESSVGKQIVLSELLISDIISGKLKSGDNIDAYLEKIEAQIDENQKLLEAAQAELEEFAAHAPQREAAKKAYEEEQERIRQQKEAAEAEESRQAEEKKRAEREAAEAARQKRLAWAQEHGSERLKKGMEQGYNCKKIFDEEYGAWLISDSGYEYDREGDVSEKDRSCPGLEALEEAERLEKIEGVSAVIVWLPKGLSELHRDRDDYCEEEAGCETVRAQVTGTNGCWYKVF